MKCLFLQQEPENFYHLSWHYTSALSMGQSVHCKPQLESGLFQTPDLLPSVQHEHFYLGKHI